MIAISKKGKKEKIVKVFDSWWNAAEWADKNITTDFENYTIGEISRFRAWLFNTFN
jgi:hypothetical protein